MTYRSPYEKRLSRRRYFRRAAAIVVLLVVCLWLDGPVYRLLSVQYPPVIEETAGALTSAERKNRLESRDWYQMFRAAGYIPTWLFIGGAAWLCERSRQGRAVVGPGLIIGALATGLAAEVLKPVLGRHRPALDGSLDWNVFLGRLLQPETYDAALGLPSSHAAVAFGAAAVLARLRPPAGGVALVAASGCALTRLLAGAHVLSDVVVAALLAWGISALVTRAVAPHERRTTLRFE